MSSSSPLGSLVQPPDLETIARQQLAMWTEVVARFDANADAQHDRSDTHDLDCVTSSSSGEAQDTLAHEKSDGGGVVDTPAVDNPGHKAQPTLSSGTRLARLHKALKREHLDESAYTRASQQRNDAMYELQRQYKDFKNLQRYRNMMADNKMSIQELQLLQRRLGRSFVSPAFGYATETAFRKLVHCLKRNPQTCATLVYESTHNSDAPLDESEVEMLLDGCVHGLFGNAYFHPSQDLQLLRFITHYVQLCVDKCQVLPKILSEDLMLTSLLNRYVRSNLGLFYVRAVLRKPILQVLGKYNLSLEVDAKRLLESMDDAQRSSLGLGTTVPNEAAKHPAVQQLLQKHADALLHWSDSFLQCIVSSVHMVPYGIRYLARRLTEHTRSRGRTAGASDVHMRMILADFIFVQLLNSAIVLPEANGIETHQLVDASCRRNLLLIATVLHKLATGKLFGGNQASAHMADLNDFIERNGPVITEYFEELIDVPDLEEYLTEAETGQLEAVSLLQDGDVALSWNDDVVERYLPVVVPQNTLVLLSKLCEEYVESRDVESEGLPRTLHRILQSMEGSLEYAQLDEEDLVVLPRPDTLEVELRGEPSASSEGDETPLTPTRQRKANLLLDVSHKLTTVMKSLGFTSGYRGSDLMHVLERERAEAQTCENHTLSAQLYETIYCIKELDADMLGEDYARLLDVLENEVLQRREAREAKASHQRVVSEYLELHALIRTVRHRRTRVLKDMTNIKFMSYVERQREMFDTFFASFFLRYGDPLDMDLSQLTSALQMYGHAKNCGYGPARLDDDQFLCPACMTLYDTKRTFVGGFLQRVSSALKSDILWRMAPEEELAVAGLTLRMFVSVNLYRSLFLYCRSAEDAFFRHVESLQHSTLDYAQFYGYVSSSGGGGASSRRGSTNGGSHDETQQWHEETLLLAIEALLQINDVMAATDKLECILRCRKVIWDTLGLTGMPSADDYIPMLCYVVLKANPSLLLSNVQYIRTFSDVMSTEYEKAFLDFCVAVKCVAVLEPKPKHKGTRMRSKTAESRRAMLGLRASVHQRVHSEGTSSSSSSTTNTTSSSGLDGHGGGGAQSGLGGGDGMAQGGLGLAGRHAGGASTGDVSDALLFSSGKRLIETGFDTDVQAIMKSMVEEQGHEARNVQAAVSVYGSNVEEVSLFLDNLRELMGMGFTREQSIDGLMVSENDKQRAIWFCLRKDRPQSGDTDATPAASGSTTGSPALTPSSSTGERSDDSPPGLSGGDEL